MSARLPRSTGFLVTLLMGGNVLAQTGPALDAAPAAPSSDKLEEVTVTARKRTERLMDVPVAATVVGAAQIRQFNMTAMADIKIVAPEITLDRGFTGSGASISMRGVSSSSLDAGVEQSVLLDYDGMAISRGRILNDALFDMEGIDVLKGPQAVFFGKNSPGGVVSVKSANPTSSLEGYVRAGYEVTSKDPSIEAALSGPVTDRIGIRVALLSSQSQGYIHNQDIGGVADLVRTAASGSTFVPAAPALLGAEDKLAGRVTLRYDDAENFDATMKLLVSRYRGQSLQSFDEVMGCPAGKTVPTIVGGIPDPTGDCKLNDRSSWGWLSPTIINSWPQVRRYDSGQPYSADDTFMPTLTMNYKLGKLSLTSVTGYYDYSYVSQGNADGTSYSYYWSYSDEKNASFYEELRAVSAFDGPLNFAAGGHFEHNGRTLYVGGANGPNLLDPATGRYNSYDNQQHNESTAFSVFAQGNWKILDNLELAGGGRFTHQSNTLDSADVYVNPSAVGFLPQGKVIAGSKSDHNVSPEATLTWHPTQDVMLYTAYKTGYLAGAFSNPGTLSAISTLHTLSFNDEKVTGFEVGAKTSLGSPNLTGSITGYRYRYTGLPLTSLIAIDATHQTFVTQNAASTITQGVELETSYHVLTGLTLKGSAAYDKAYFQDFATAQCYTGQTAALGCIVNPVTHAATQNLTSKDVYRAPRWLMSGGFVYDFNVSSRAHLSVNADGHYSDGYYTGLNLNPASYQHAFTTLNAGARLSTDDDKWSLALIGRNLANVRYGTLGVDKPGGSGEVFTVAGEPRVVLFQVEARY